MAEDLTGGEGESWGREQEMREEKNEREKRGSRGRRVSTGAFLKWQCDLFIEEKEQVK